MRYSREPINNFKNRLGQWPTSGIPSTPSEQRTLMAMILLFCIFVLVIVLLGYPETEKKVLIFVAIGVAFITLFYLLYVNYRESENALSMRNPYAEYASRTTTSPFNPRTEESSKRLLREASEQLESSSKMFSKRPSFPYETSINPKDSTITRRRLDFTRRDDYGRRDEFSRREEPSSFQMSGYAANNQSMPNIPPSSIFNRYAQNQTLNQFQREPKKLSNIVPSTFVFDNVRGSSPIRMNDSMRMNYHMTDGNIRKGSDIAFSSSPIRNAPGMRAQQGRASSIVSTKILNDEQFGTIARGITFQKQMEDAEKQVYDLKINQEFYEWKKNCQRWFSAKLIPRILDGNMSNIKELNRIIGYFDKRLYEYEYILKLDQGRPTENITQKSQTSIITIDELLNYEASFRAGGPIWPTNNISLDGVKRAHQDLTTLMNTRRQLEKYFEIEGFRTFEIFVSRIRTYILERLFRFKENFTLNFKFSDDEIRRKYPTDTQILSNLFFTFLNAEAVIQSDEKEQIYRNFVFKTNTNTKPFNLSTEDVYFRQTTLGGCEPHFDIISGQDIWPVVPGKDNLFCAIVLFVYHIKIKKHGTLGFEESRSLKEFMSMVIP